MDHDRLFKNLLETFFTDFLDLFVPKLAASVDRSSIVFLNKEVFPDLTTGERREADVIAQVKLRSDPAFFLIHLEHQAQAQPEFPRRMFAYFARLLEKHACPVYPIALFSYEKPRRPEPEEYRLEFPDLDVLTFRFRAVQLNRLAWRDYAQQNNPIAAALLARMRRTATEKLMVLRSALELVAGLHLSPGDEHLVVSFLNAYLDLTPEESTTLIEEVKQLPPKQRELVMGKAMGFLDHARQEGRQEATLGVVGRLLRKRLGTLDAALEARVTALSLRRLEQLAEALLDFTAPSDLEAWLKTHARKRNTE